ncbi:MAG: AAA family ATPase [Saprospiraceae bacterium]
MRITSLALTNFKRFTRLVLEPIPKSAKLVLLIGANGSGKSSVLDAFEYVNSLNRRDGIFDPKYYPKQKGGEPSVFFATDRGLAYRLPSKDLSLPSGSFFGRTSFRQTPQLTRRALGASGFNFEKDNDRPRLFIHRDERFENDVEHITGIILREFFRSDESKEQIRGRFIEPLNQALERIFGGENGTQLRLLEIIPPLEGNVAQINFRKGQSEIHYNFLSAGEKEVFNILVGLLSRREQYQDTVFFFDELDLHLNTSVQFNFLKELTEHWIPENCQLWTASHSLGFIQFANESTDAVILDFDNLDFDLPQTIAPQPKEGLDVYEIAVPRSMIFEMMKGKQIVICENQNDEFYNLIGLPNTVFVGVKDARDVFLHVKREARYLSLRDRDFLSDTEIERIRGKYPNHRILRYYNFENYIYHPDNIAELAPPGFDSEAYKAEILRQKKAQLLHIVASMEATRRSYEEFKTDEKLRDKELTGILTDFESDDFERFYKFFDMKKQFDKSCLRDFNLNKSLLVRTRWFRAQIGNLLSMH